MKRYIIEYANDIIRAAQKAGNDHAIHMADIAVILNRNGLMTDFETMKRLADIDI